MDAKQAATALSEVVGRTIAEQEVLDYGTEKITQDNLLDHARAFEHKGAIAKSKGAKGAAARPTAKPQGRQHLDAEPMVGAVIDQVRQFGGAMDLLEQDAAALIGARARAVPSNVAAIANQQLLAAAGDIDHFRLDFQQRLDQVRTDLGLLQA
ncbi:MAG: hypothetical protein HC771_13125 [Synechococcales cyanobacterium CRU_2_2]|nr:hypothetical protein [Synechococcales cyanobacterium CRU_2_2]